VGMVRLNVLCCRVTRRGRVRLIDSSSRAPSILEQHDMDATPSSRESADDEGTTRRRAGSYSQ
jgi:hypothetical protein